MSITSLNQKSGFLRAAAILIAGLLITAIYSCGQSTTDGVLTLKVNASNFKVDIPASGELEASTSTTINVPSGLNGPQSLAWIISNFSEVKTGDVIAKMDSDRESYKMKWEQFSFDRLGLDSQIQTGKDKTIYKNLNMEIELTDQERQLASRFFSQDERVYSKIDIIDQMRNKDYLKAKKSFYNWSIQQHDAQAHAEQELIKLKQKGHQEKINGYSKNLNQMEIIAPHDGLFVVQPSWNGALPVIGDMMWPGTTIGTLPDTSKMQAKLYVLESEALGLAVGEPVTLYLDAYPEIPISGTLAQLDAIAKPKAQGSPVNYFEIKVTINKTIQEIMLPGRQVNANVHALDLKNVITIPNQTLFQKSGEYWVYLKTSAGFIRQKVQPGNRSLNRTVIIEGLTQGDIIALTTPPERK